MLNMGQFLILLSRSLVFMQLQQVFAPSTNVFSGSLVFVTIKVFSPVFVTTLIYPFLLPPYVINFTVPFFELPYFTSDT